MIWLSKNISYEEMIFSEYAARNNIDNTLPDSLTDNLVKTAICLQVIRAYWNKPIIISSGYRCRELNAAIGGSDKSHHTLGLAADFTIPGVPIGDLIKSIQDLVYFDQLINEYNRWVHLSIYPTMRSEVFKIA